MAEIDDEVLERVRRWCAEAGRQAGSAEIRRALAPLTWDEILVVRALLADPPPARPLGPHALADIARGTPADVAAEREREGRYPAETGEEEPSPRPSEPPRALPVQRRQRSRPARGPAVVIRRARDRVADAQPAAPALPPLDELRRPEGRGVLERLLRRHGGRRMALVGALATGWRMPSGAAPGEEDLSALLEHHGLARAFAHRERDEILHALRAAGGMRADAAARLALDAAGLDAALERLGAAGEAERIRERARRALRARGTLAERARLLLAEEARLRDLGLLHEFEEDLRARLPEHVRALRAAAVPLAVALSRSLAVTAAQGAELVARFGLAGPAEPPPPREGTRERRPRGKVPGPRRGAPRSRAATGRDGGRKAPRPPRRQAPGRSRR